MEYYNLNKLIKISVLESEKSEMYYWQDYKPKRGFFSSDWGSEVKEGVYSRVIGTEDRYESVPENHFVKDKEVFLKDRVFLWFEGDITKVCYFDNLNYAEQFAKDIINCKCNFVLISRNVLLY